VPAGGRYRRAFEPGCATGLITERLATRCDEVLACDSAARAVDLARERLARTPNVTVALGAIPEQWPDGRFDLIVLSEVGYYCDDIDALTSRVTASLTTTGSSARLPLAGIRRRSTRVRQPRSRALGHLLKPLVHHLEDDFLLDVWSSNGESVARADGILG